MEKERYVSYSAYNYAMFVDTEKNETMDISDITKFLNQQDARIKELESQVEKWKQDYENCSELEKNLTKEHQYCLDNWRACEQENQQLKFENGNLKEKISTQLQNNADNVDFMENQRKEIEQLKEELKDIKNNYRGQINSLLTARLNLFKQLKQSQNQKAIEELKKIKNYFLDTEDWLVDSCAIEEYIDNLIKELRSVK